MVHLLGAIGLVRIRMLIGSAQSAHPQEMESLLARRGYSEKPVEAGVVLVLAGFAIEVFEARSI